MTNKDRLRKFFDDFFRHEYFTISWHNEEMTVTDRSHDSLTFCIRDDRIYNMTERKYEVEL